jgi:hypothetical protein
MGFVSAVTAADLPAAALGGRELAHCGGYSSRAPFTRHAAVKGDHERHSRCRRSCVASRHQNCERWFRW